MKKILFLLFLLPTLTHAQKVALLNTNFKSPIIYTDSVTVQQTVSGLFPVGINDFDTLYADLDYINKMLSIRQRSKMKSFELHAGQTVIKISRVPFSNGDRYLIKAATNNGELQSNLNLTDITKSNKKNFERIEKMMDYLKTNKSLFTKPYEIHPKIYNVVVITE
jgi:hypothetical protein